MAFGIDSLRINDIVSKAGELLVNLSQDPRNRVPYRKGDGSPVTLTDRALSDLLFEGLSPLYPVVCEERPPHQVPPGVETYFLIDPLDGTKYYSQGENEYAISVGLIHQGKPVYGAIFDPHEEELLWAAQGQGAFYGMKKLGPLKVKSQEPLKAFSSGFHRHPEGEELLEIMGIGHVIEKGSALKFCDIALGKVDIYLRFGLTSEWDTAAAQAILQEIGGDIYEVSTLKSLGYQKKDWVNSGLFAGEKQTLERLSPYIQMAKERRQARTHGSND